MDALLQDGKGSIGHLQTVEGLSQVEQDSGGAIERNTSVVELRNPHLGGVGLGIRTLESHAAIASVAQLGDVDNLILRSTG